MYLEWLDFEAEQKKKGTGKFAWQLECLRKLTWVSRKLTHILRAPCAGLRKYSWTLFLISVHLRQC